MIRLKKAVFHNRAPFEDLILDFGDANLAILSGINGKGKTTILSHITDAFYEIARESKEFNNEFEGKENKFYRVSSSIWNMRRGVKDPSIVYFRFAYEGENYDYLDIRVDWEVTDEDIEKLEGKYSEVLKSMDDSISFDNVKDDLKRRGYSKKLDSKFNTANVKDLFEQNILTYFPAYRFEKPAYLNDPYQVKLDFKKETEFSGYLLNPIEVVSDLPNIANWFLDVILDRQMGEDSHKSHIIDLEINKIIVELLRPKYVNDWDNWKGLHLGVGKRNSGAERISIARGVDNKNIYPSIFNMSSGEVALLCIFGELLKQADKLNKLMDVSGIVLIDEVDKHLHIKLQKEVLPNLFAMFPNVQFIVTSHSPFLSMGLADIKESYKSKIFDLDNAGFESEPQNNKQYNEVYEMMLGEKNLMREKLEEAYSQIKAMSKPVIITEGKTDIKHLKNAMQRLNIKNLEVEFYKFSKDEKMGDGTLRVMLQYFARTKQAHRIIGIFDRDVDDSIKEFSNIPYKDFGNNVFAFAIPLVNQDIYKTEKISIEHYYSEENLKKEGISSSKDGEITPLKRLFLGSEFYPNGESQDKKYFTKCSKCHSKIGINGIIDEKVYSKNDIDMRNPVVLSKDEFADLVSTVWGDDFNYENFRKIFDVIKEIIDYQEP